MKNHYNEKSRCRLRALSWATGLLLAAALVSAAPLLAADYQISGASDTILRIGTTLENRGIYTLTEYLRLSVAAPVKEGGTLSLQLGGWGRADLGHRSRDGYHDGALQYGYLSYRGAQNNLVLNAGRQFVTEGVAAQHLDGLYLRSDLAAGFAAAAYLGAPVATEPSLEADDFMVGGRVSRSDYKRYALGVSALKSLAAGEGYREEQGIDLWLHPAHRLDIVGRSSYNSITRGWMEHAYSASFAPIDQLQLYAELSSINYRDYFHRVTSNALFFDPLVNGIDPDEKLLNLGAGASYAISSNLSVAAHYKHFDYEVDRDAQYYGAKLSGSIPGWFGGGLSVHRMAGGSQRLRYTEYRLYASKKLGKADLSLDLIDLNYDSKAAMNGVENAVSIAASGSYQLQDSTRLGASLDYSRNPFFDQELRGLVKLTYLFDLNRAAQGGDRN